MERTSVYAGSRHKGPLPNACRLGNILVSGLVGGADPETDQLPPTLEEQTVNLFKQIRLIALAGGADMDRIAKITVYMKDRGGREPLNREWVKHFPDPASRPARQVMEALPGNLDGGKLILAEFLAVLPT